MIWACWTNRQQTWDMATVVTCLVVVAVAVAAVVAY